MVTFAIYVAPIAVVSGISIFCRWVYAEFITSNKVFVNVWIYQLYISVMIVLFIYLIYFSRVL